MRRPKTVFGPYPKRRNSKLELQKVKIESKPKVRIEEYIEKKSFFALMSKPPTDFEPHHDHKNSPLGPQKDKNKPQNQVK